MKNGVFYCTTTKKTYKMVDGSCVATYRGYVKVPVKTELGNSYITPTITNVCPV